MSNVSKCIVERIAVIPPGYSSNKPSHFSEGEFEVALDSEGYPTVLEDLCFSEASIRVYKTYQGDDLLVIHPLNFSQHDFLSFRESIQVREIGFTFDSSFVLNLSSLVISDVTHCMYVLLPDSNHVHTLIVRDPSTLQLFIWFYYSEGGDRYE